MIYPAVNHKSINLSLSSWTYTVPKVEQHTVSTLHLMGLQPGNECPDQQPHLRSVQ